MTEQAARRIWTNEINTINIDQEFSVYTIDDTTTCSRALRKIQGNREMWKADVWHGMYIHRYLTLTPNSLHASVCSLRLSLLFLYLCQFCSRYGYNVKFNEWKMFHLESDKSETTQDWNKWFFVGGITPTI